MGCRFSSHTRRPAPAAQVQGSRRLSMDNGVADIPETADVVTEEDRGLIQALDSKDLLELARAGDSRKMSIASSDHGVDKSAYAFKGCTKLGDDSEPGIRCLGYTCRKGLKPENPNQDSWCAIMVEQRTSMYAVFDGHGRFGHQVSNFVKERMPKLMMLDSRWGTDEVPAMLVDVFERTQRLVTTADSMKTLSAQMSGTTASVVIHDQVRGKLTVAHAGGSKVVLGSFKNREKNELQATELTHEHRPHLPEERARIEAAGGRVVFDGCANHRVFERHVRFPGLHVSRCIGDVRSHSSCGIVATPEVCEWAIAPSDHVLLVCSDGIWEFMHPIEAVTMVSGYHPTEAMAAADRLAKEAWDRWVTQEGGQIVDDITVILVYLNQQDKTRI